MFYAQLAGELVVYVVAFDGGKAIVLTAAGELRAVDLSKLRIPDSNKVTPFARWPDLVVKSEDGDG